MRALKGLLEKWALAPCGPFTLILALKSKMSPQIIFGILCLSIIVVVILVMLWRGDAPVTNLKELPFLFEGSSDDPEWHEYYENVYGTKVKGIVNLNLFTFFYYHSPLGTPAGITDIDLQLGGPLKFGDAWRAFGPYPEAYISKTVGFFVHRHVDPSYFAPDRKLEVFRTDVNTSGLYHESKVSWFYHTVGSGIFIRIPKKLLVIVHRSDLQRLYGLAFPDLDKDCAHVLDALKIDMLVCILSRPLRAPFRTEIILRRTKPQGEQGACAQPLQLFSGPGGDVPCSCTNKDQQFINCKPGPQL